MVEDAPAPPCSADELRPEYGDGLGVEVPDRDSKRAGDALATLTPLCDAETALLDDAVKTWLSVPGAVAPRLRVSLTDLLCEADPVADPLAAGVTVAD